MKTHILNIQAGGFVDVNATGDFLRVLESTAALLVETDNGLAARMEKGQGVKTPGPFDGFRVSDLGGAGVVVTVAAGFGEYLDGRLVGTVRSEPAPSVSLSTATDVSVTVAAQVIAANSGRRAVLVAAHPDNTANVKIGDSNVTTARGLSLQPGQSVSLDTTAAVWAVAVSGTQKVELVEV